MGKKQQQQNPNKQKNPEKQHFLDGLLVKQQKERSESVEIWGQMVLTTLDLQQ